MLPSNSQRSHPPSNQRIREVPESPERKIMQGRLIPSKLSPFRPPNTSPGRKKRTHLWDMPTSVVEEDNDDFRVDDLIWSDDECSVPSTVASSISSRSNRYFSHRSTTLAEQHKVRPTREQLAGLFVFQQSPQPQRPIPIKSYSYPGFSDHCSTPRKSNTTRSFSNRFLFDNNNNNDDDASSRMTLSTVPCSTYEYDTPSRAPLAKSNNNKPSLPPSLLDAQIEQDSWSSCESIEFSSPEPSMDTSAFLTPEAPRGFVGKLQMEAKILAQLVEVPFGFDDSNHHDHPLEDVQQQVLDSLLETRMDVNKRDRTTQEPKKKTKKDTVPRSVTTTNDESTTNEKSTAAGETSTTPRPQLQPTLSLTDIFQWSRRPAGRSEMEGDEKLVNEKHNDLDTPGLPSDCELVDFDASSQAPASMESSCSSFESDSSSERPIQLMPALQKSIKAESFLPREEERRRRRRRKKKDKHQRYGVF